MPSIGLAIDPNADPAIDPNIVNIYKPKKIYNIHIDERTRTCHRLTELLSEPRCFVFTNDLAKQFLMHSRSVSARQNEEESYYIGCDGPSGTVLFKDKTQGRWKLNFDSTGTVEIGSITYLLVCDDCDFKEVPCPSTK